MQVRHQMCPLDTLFVYISFSLLEFSRWDNNCQNAQLILKNTVKLITVIDVIWKGSELIYQNINYATHSFVFPQLVTLQIVVVHVCHIFQMFVVIKRSLRVNGRSLINFVEIVIHLNKSLTYKQRILICT